MPLQVEIRDLPMRILPRKIKHRIFAAQLDREVSIHESLVADRVARSLEPPQKTHDFLLRPIAVVGKITLPVEGSGLRADKRTMPSIIGFHERDVGIVSNLSPRSLRDADERIVRGIQNQRRNGDLLDRMRRRSSIVIVVN